MVFTREHHLTSRAIYHLYWLVFLLISISCAFAISLISSLVPLFLLADLHDDRR
jgi:hypothetical protein